MNLADLHALIKTAPQIPDFFLMRTEILNMVPLKSTHIQTSANNVQAVTYFGLFNIYFDNIGMDVRSFVNRLGASPIIVLLFTSDQYSKIYMYKLLTQPQGR